MEIFGIPTQALFGQLLVGLINGSFYAMLSLGLAVIFGLLNVINFTHGAQYMMGAFCAWFLLEKWGIGYWWSLLLAPMAVGLTGVVIERTMLARLYKLDHLYGLLLTFGLALIIQGVFTNYYGSAGQPYRLPEEFTGAFNLGFMYLPKYRMPVDVVRHRAHEARLVPARRDRKSGAGPGLRHQRPADDHAHVRFRRRIGRARGRNGRADLPGQSANGR
jgi:branched-chain amino acid transport system permease protein